MPYPLDHGRPADEHVGMTGFEPATSCSQSKRSTKLSYIPQPPWYHGPQPAPRVHDAAAGNGPPCRVAPSAILPGLGEGDVRRLIAAALVVASSVFSLAPASAADPKPFTYETARALVTVREPQIAPDGSRVVYVRSVGDYKADGNDTELVLVDVASGARRVLTRDRI